jgi:hypothetical protein
VTSVTDVVFPPDADNTLLDNDRDSSTNALIRLRQTRA